MSAATRDLIVSPQMRDGMAVPSAIPHSIVERTLFRAQRQWSSTEYSRPVLLPMADAFDCAGRPAVHYVFRAESGEAPRSVHLSAAIEAPSPKETQCTCPTGAPRAEWLPIDCT